MTIRAAVFVLALGTAGGARFEGSVVERESGAAIRGARVQLRAAGARRLTADLETDGDGRFAAAVDIAPGSYRLVVTKGNHAAAGAALTLPLAAPAEIRMTRFGSIRGRVTDGQNRPLGGGAVFALRAEAGVYRPAPGLPTAEVDSAGNYRLFGLGEGDYAVGISWATMNPGASVAGSYLYPSNRKPEVFRIRSGVEIAGIDFALPSQSVHAVRGRVRVEAGKTASVALVAADQAGLATAMMRTAEDGTFAFERVPPGSYEIAAAAPARGYSAFGAVLGEKPLFGRVRVDVAAEVAEGIEISLEAGRTVLLGLEAAEGCPARATVVLDAVANWGAMVSRTAELTGGETAVADLAPGRYTVRVTKPEGEGCYGLASAVDAAAATAARVQVVRAGRVDGRAEGVRGLCGISRADEPGREEEWAALDSDGRFRFGDVRPGRYLIRCGDRSTALTVAAGETVAAVLPAEEGAK